VAVSVDPTDFVALPSWVIVCRRHHSLISRNYLNLRFKKKLRLNHLYRFVALPSWVIVCRCHHSLTSRNYLNLRFKTKKRLWYAGQHDEPQPSCGANAR
jgi:hypothetical protein